MKKATSSESFKETYYEALPNHWRWQTTPIQLYPLEQLSSYLKLPTPFVKIDYNFLVFITKGVLHEQIGTEKLIIDEASLVFVKAGNIISVDNMQKNLQGYFLLIEEEAIKHILPQNKMLLLDQSYAVLKLEKQLKKWLQSLYELLQLEIKYNSNNLDTAYSLVQGILHKYLQLSSNQPIETRNQQIAFEFRRLVNEYYITEKSPTYYAKILKISPNYLNRCVKSVFNKSAKELILHVIVVQSQLRLIDKSKTIAEVCYELDIQDPSYFARLFKKITGQTPSEYQQFNAVHTLSYKE